MEQKKTLLIIAAVGAFLLAVLGAACIIYTPNAKPYSNVTSVSPVEKHQNTTTSGWTNPPVEDTSDHTLPVPGNTQDLPATAKVSDMVVFADNATVYDMNKNEVSSNNVSNPEATTIDLSALKREITQETPSSVQPQNINITVNIPETKTETISTITTTPEYKPTPKAPVQPPKDSAPKAKPAENKKVEQKKTEPAKTTKPAKNTTVTPNPAPKKVTQYWVQVAAYGSKKGAEEARSVLDENKIQADIFTYKNNKDKLFYRVRVGPYTTKSEAEYWCSKISKIDDFAKAESFVTSTSN